MKKGREAGKGRGICTGPEEECVKSIPEGPQPRMLIAHIVTVPMGGTTKSGTGDLVLMNFLFDDIAPS